jgi:hypothetical protein
MRGKSGLKWNVEAQTSNVEMIDVISRSLSRLTKQTSMERQGRPLEQPSLLPLIFCYADETPDSGCLSAAGTFAGVPFFTFSFSSPSPIGFENPRGGR